MVEHAPRRAGSSPTTAEAAPSRAAGAPPREWNNILDEKKILESPHAPGSPDLPAIDVNGSTTPIGIALSLARAAAGMLTTQADYMVRGRRHSAIPAAAKATAAQLELEISGST